MRSKRTLGGKESECEGLVFSILQRTIARGGILELQTGPRSQMSDMIRALKCISPPTCMYMKAVETHAKHKENVTEKRVGEINARYPELPFLIFDLTRVERSLFYPQSSRSEPMRSTFLTPHCRRKPSSSGHQSPITSSTSFGKSSPRSIVPCHR